MINRASAILFSLLLFSFIYCNAQVVTVYPALATESTSPVTIYFHADQGSQGLKDFTGDIYIHTGVITSKEKWVHVPTTWASTNAAHKLVKISANLYSFTISNLRTFYNMGADTSKIIGLAMVFRNGTGTIKGTNEDGSDIFYYLVKPGQVVAKFFSPNVSPTLLELNDVYSCTFQSSITGTLTFTDNGAPLNTYNTDSVTFNYTALVHGKHLIIGTASDGTNTASDTVTFIVRGAPLVQDFPGGTKIGINYLNDTTVRLVLCAPNKQYVFVLGEFNNWEVDEAYYMNKTTDGKYWWVDITGLQPGEEYAYEYFVDGLVKVADPYTDKVLDPNTDKNISNITYPGLKTYPVGGSGILSVLQTAQTPYNWQIDNFVKPNYGSMVIYELLVRDFVATHSYHTLIDTLNYLKELGVNAIELMPISEFDDNESWGYNPSFYFAPDKYYGPKDSLKRFIDVCHQNGIAVIIDMAMNGAMGTNSYAKLYWDGGASKPTVDNPWFNRDARHPYSIGNDFNHESAYTKKYFTDITRYWLGEFKLDGFRFDLSKGYTQKNSGNDVGIWGAFDQSRIDIWHAYYDSIKSYYPTAYLILEHLGDNNEEKNLANIGFLLWGNISGAYAQAAMSYNSPSWDFNWVSYKQRGWAVPNVVGYMESHDEERLMYKCLTYGKVYNNYSIKNTTTALERAALCANLFITVPGPKMIWQFGELGYDVNIDFGCRVCNKPIKWQYFTEFSRYRLFRVYAELIKLKKTYPAFSTNNYSISFGNDYKQLQLFDNAMNVMACGNFDVADRNFTGNFPHTGTWYNFYDGKSINVTSNTFPLDMKAGEYRLYTDVKLPAAYLGVPTSVEGFDQTSNKVFEVYPNPAAENAVLTFYVAQQGAATLDIFDLTGKHIATLVDEKQLAKGFYTTPLSTLGLSEGTYILRLTGGREIATQKIIIQ